MLKRLLAGLALAGIAFSAQADNSDTQALVTLTAQAAATVNSADLPNATGQGVIVGVNLSTMTSATVTVHVQGKDAASGQYYDLLASTALASTGFTTMTVYPGVVASANVAANAPLPKTWRVSVVVTGTAATGTVGASVIQ